MKTAFLALFVFAATAFAQHVAVAPEVTSVATVGRWQGKGASGSYRVVVVRDGWEHVWSRVYVEWQQDPTEREGPMRAPVSVQELIPPGIAQGTAVLEATARASKPGAIEITVRATSNMEVGSKVQTFIYAAGQPGVTQLIRGGPRAMTPNPSLKRSANGRPPSPVWRYAVHFRQPGPGVLPSSPA